MVKKVQDPRQSAYARPVLQRPAVVLLEQIMSEPLEVFLAQDRWVLCNATKAWRNLFNVDPGTKADDHAMSRHPEYWYQDNKEGEAVQTVLKYLHDVDISPECAYHIRAGDVYLNPWLLVEWAGAVVPEYGQALREMEASYDTDDTDS